MPAKAALKPAWCIGTECISVAAVTSAGGFALTASPFCQTPQKEPKGLAPAYGLRCAQVPSLRCLSGGIASSDVLDCVEGRCAPIP
ncbi:hypothetical protein CW358_00695 [Pseudomonas protegens]|nr:hypothetical protein CW358_00695 [Pseudomonas protegens]